MPLSQLLYILQYQKLPFVQLSKMRDRDEGAPPQAVVDFYIQQLEKDEINYASEVLRQSYEINQCFAYVSCWYQDDYESAGMWDSYGKDGIVIQTTYRRLVDSITDSRPIFVGCVEYENNPVRYSVGQTLPLVLRKRTYYKNEHELRAVYVEKTRDSIEEQLKLVADAKPAVDIEIDVNRLIRKIFVPRKSQPWWRTLINDLLSNQYGLDIQVESSWVDKEPRLWPNTED